MPPAYLTPLDCAWLSYSIYSFAGCEELEIFNYMFSDIMSPDLLITRQLISDSWLVSGITSHVPEFRGMASGVKCHTEQSATPYTCGGHLLVSVGATTRYPHCVLFAPVTQNAYDVELSATRSKVSHHTHGGPALDIREGHLYVSTTASVVSLPFWSSTWHVTIIILGTWDIWSLLHSDTDTHISDPNDFYWSTHHSTDC